ncbi:MAG: IS110 family transposase [Thermoleophilia bacterium]
MLVCGIDAHTRVFEVCVVDEVGAPVARTQAANTPAGHTQILEWLTGQLPEVPVRVGIEGGGNWGLRLAWALTRAGLQVREVPGHYTARERMRLRGAGRSDARDALAIARIVAREPALPPIRKDDLTRQLKLLVDYRKSLGAERTRTQNRVLRDLGMLGIQPPPRGLRGKKNLTRLTDQLHADPRPQAEIARRRLGRITQIDTEITELTRMLTPLVAATGTSLTDLLGIGTVNAARILGEVGDITRYRNRDAFAAANGTAPIPASSGNTTRMRLSRAGNRRLNHALHQMALTQISHPGPGKEFYRRRRQNGDGPLEALRALKRRLSNVVYRQLLADATHPSEPAPG